LALSCSVRASLRYRIARTLLMPSQIPTQQGLFADEMELTLEVRHVQKGPFTGWPRLLTNGSSISPRSWSVSRTAARSAPVTTSPSRAGSTRCRDCCRSWRTQERNRPGPCRRS
jgi:hypothetical protein